jgi:uncharacterized cofD-like protein
VTTGRVPRLAVLGGGTGLAVLLRALKLARGLDADRDGLSGVVTVTDDGGSSGRLRRDFGVLPPGDIRNCLVALAKDEDLLTRLFQYRFANGDGLSGHSFGNLFLTALTGITGDFYQAILTAESVLSVRGRILPATLTDVRLRARGASGRWYEGESAIGGAGERLAELTLQPAAAAAFPAAVEAVEQADLVVLGPGSLYTSILPNLLIPGIRDAVRRGRARAVLVLNLMTQPGETDGMSGLDHLDAIERHAGAGLIDTVVANAAPLPADRLARYAAQGAVPVAVDRAAFEARGVELILADLVADQELLRHDVTALGRLILNLAQRTAQQTAQPAVDLGAGNEAAP